MITDIELAKTLLINNNNNPLQVALFAVQQIKKIEALKNEIKKLNLAFEEESDYQNLIKTTLSKVTYSDILVTQGKHEIIKFFWNRKSDTDFILDHHRKALYETAEDLISKEIEKGYTSGELTDNIFMADDDIENNEEGISYIGKWSIQQNY